MFCSSAFVSANAKKEKKKKEQQVIKAALMFGEDIGSALISNGVASLREPGGNSRPGQPSHKRGPHPINTY